MEQLNNKKLIIINSLITIIIIIVGLTLMYNMYNKRILSLQSSINGQTASAKLSQKKSDMSAFENQLIDTIDQASNSVVSIIISKSVKFYVESPANMVGPGTIHEQTAKIGGGSGIIFDKDGYIITNKHVVQDISAKYSVVLNNGATYNVDKIRFDDLLDIAILKIIDDDGKIPENLVSATIIGMNDSVKIGQFAIAIGNSLSEFPNSVTMGIISARNRELKINKSNLYVGLYQTDTPINAGNSGGPLLNIYGEVIGINTAISDVGQGVAFALPITQEFVDATLKSIKEYDKIVRPLIGIAYVDINNDIKTQLKLNVDQGIYIKDVFSDLPGSVAGLKIGDVVVAINDKLINAQMPFLYQLYIHNPGENINLKILRGQETMNIPIVLGENN